MSIRIEGREIVFKGNGRHQGELRRPLLSGFICPRCKEILKAYFATDGPVDMRDFISGYHEQDMPFSELSVSGGQAIISTTHQEYNACGLEIFWAPSLIHNLVEWLQKERLGESFRFPQAVKTAVMSGRIEGLIAITDVVNPENFLLGYDEEKWSPPWQHKQETFSKFEERRNRETQIKLHMLGVEAG